MSPEEKQKKSSDDLQAESKPHPDPEVVAKGRRRTFTTAYKARIVALADACETGEIGALLRREGLYYGSLQRWRRQRDEGTLEGLAPKKRGPAPHPDKDLKKRLVQLEKENQRLAKRLSKAELIIDVQKKVASLLGIPLATVDSDPDEEK